MFTLVGGLTRTSGRGSANCYATYATDYFYPVIPQTLMYYNMNTARRRYPIPIVQLYCCA